MTSLGLRECVGGSEEASRTKDLSVLIVELGWWIHFTIKKKKLARKGLFLQ